MQAVIPALFPIGGGVGDVLPGLLPPDAVPLALHEQNELVPVSGVPHTLVDGVHQTELPALSSGGGVVLRAGHGLDPLLPWLEYRQAELHAHLIVALAQLSQFRFADVQLFPILEADAVDEEVGVDVVTVNVGADQNLPPLEPLCQLQCGGVRGHGIYFFVRWEGLHHVIEHRATLFVV